MTNGPILILAQFARERLPQRMEPAAGWASTALRPSGRDLEAGHSESAWEGAKTLLTIRFVTTTGEAGATDVERDVFAPEFSRQLRSRQQQLPETTI